MDQSSNYHHALPIAVSEPTEDSTTSLCLPKSGVEENELNSWMATLRDIWFNDVNAVPIETHRVNTPED